MKNWEKKKPPYYSLQDEKTCDDLLNFLIPKKQQ